VINSDNIAIFGSDPKVVEKSGGFAPIGAVYATLASYTGVTIIINSVTSTGSTKELNETKCDICKRAQLNLC